MNWFKFYGQDYLTDPKMLSLTPTEKALWLTMLCLADHETGVIKHIDETKIMMLTGINPLDDEWSENDNFLDKFETLSMIQRDNKMITLINFTKRQQQNLSGYERVKKYREKKKIEAKNDNKPNVINDNARIDKNRIDKNNITNVIVKQDFGNDNINLLSKYFLQELQIPKEDCSQQESRRYWNLLLKESKSGVEGVKWLVDQAKSDEFYRNNITSSKDLYYKRVKLMTRKRAEIPRVAVMPKEL